MHEIRLDNIQIGYRESHILSFSAEEGKNTARFNIAVDPNRELPAIIHRGHECLVILLEQLLVQAKGKAARSLPTPSPDSGDQPR